MAENEERKGFPMLAPSHWWKLRNKFRQSIPGVMTDSYLATVLDMAEGSARTNVSPYMKAFGLINSDGKPTELVKQWRDDEGYAAACKTILEATYSQELIHAIDDVATGRPKAERWFQNKLGVGQNAAGKLASIFMVVYEGDASKAPDARSTVVPKKAVKTVQAPKTVEMKTERKPVVPASLEQEYSNGERKHSPSSGPEVNINLQIHISADASPDQIDQIFISISKHLYKNGN